MKLLRWVRQPSLSGFDFDGVLFPAGKLISRVELNPPGFPQVPILLEMAGPVPPFIRGKPSLYDHVLWRYDGARNDWLELARVKSSSSDWAIDLGIIAARAIQQQTGPPDLSEIEERIRTFLDSELGRVRGSDRNRLLGVIHDELAVRLSTGFEGGWAGLPSHPPSFLNSTRTH